jgi:LuxR family transcriptional regulator, maltose regulon positive regulatory protein
VSGPLLTTKLQQPALRPDAVPRARLFARLEEGLRLGRPLTLVSAPAGFGKSTLIRQWIDSLGRPAAWLLLEDGDDDPARLAAYLAAALGCDSASSSEPIETIQVLINALAEACADRLLVLDDYHAIRNFAAHDLVTYLIAHQPPCFHLVIVTREDQPLPLARLRARDQLTEIRERHLRFTDDEVDSFFRETLHLELPPASVALLAARTEGWITALQLAGIALSGAQDASGFVAAFAGDDRYIVDYLMEEVLAEQPEDLRQFLRETSILERLSAPLCDAITGRQGSQGLLEKLEAENLFVSPLDNRREWWRYHALFAEALRFGLTPARERELHLKAAAWLEAAGMAETALKHARAAARLAPAVPLPRQGATSAGANIGRSQPLIEPLSERELEVLRLVAAGLSNQAIADRLIIAEGTVKRHINNIYGKLQVGSRTQAVSVARDLHLL